MKKLLLILLCVPLIVMGQSKKELKSQIIQKNDSLDILIDKIENNLSIIEKLNKEISSLNIKNQKLLSLKNNSEKQKNILIENLKIHNQILIDSISNLNLSKSEMPSNISIQDICFSIPVRLKLLEYIDDTDPIMNCPCVSLTFVDIFTGSVNREEILDQTYYYRYNHLGLPDVSFQELKTGAYYVIDIKLLGTGFDIEDFGYEETVINIKSFSISDFKLYRDYVVD